MAKVNIVGKAHNWVKTNALTLDEFVPVVYFDHSSYSRPNSARLVQQTHNVKLSDKIEKSKRSQKVWELTTLPGSMTLPFTVEKGYGTWDDAGVVGAKIDPENADVAITGSHIFKVRYGEKVKLELRVLGYKEKEFNVDFYANDTDDDYNSGEFKDVHCGRIVVKMAGSSEVGFRLISNIDALPDAPSDHDFIENPMTQSAADIARSQKEANQYNNCRGVCYAVSASRVQQAYIDVTGSGVVDLSVRNTNIDHRIASTQGTNDPFMGYGAGGPFARHGRGEAIDNSRVWAGELKKGAMLQVWHSTDTSDLFGGGGHSVIFRNYTYDDNGEITALEFTDYWGGVRTWNRSEYENSETILGVNLLDYSL